MSNYMLDLFISKVESRLMILLSCIPIHLKHWVM